MSKERFIILTKLFINDELKDARVLNIYFDSFEKAEGYFFDSEYIKVDDDSYEYHKDDEIYKSEIIKVFEIN